MSKSRKKAKQLGELKPRNPIARQLESTKYRQRRMGDKRNWILDRWQRSNIKKDIYD